MAKKKKRPYLTITFKVYPDEDADILEWWDGIENGDRSSSIRDLIRVRDIIMAEEKNQTDPQSGTVT